jgi:hypothetical protein
MRYKETKGHLPFMKAKGKGVEPTSGEVSPGSNGIFKTEEPEKNVQAASIAPARTFQSR